MGWAKSDDLVQRLRNAAGRAQRGDRDAFDAIEEAIRSIRERDVFRQALADVYTGRLDDGPLYDDGMVVAAIDRRVHRALFEDTTPPPEGYPR